MHNIYINNILYIIITSTYFDPPRYLHGVGASKHVGVLTIFKILLIYIYIYKLFIVGLDNKLYKTHGT